MPKVLMPPQTKKSSNKITTPSVVAGGSNGDNISVVSSTDFDDFTATSSILEFLAKEQECCYDVDAESIFQEVSRLADNSDTRSVDEILHEAELLLQQQQQHFVSEPQKESCRSSKRSSDINIVNAVKKNGIKLNTKFTKSIDNIRPQNINKEKKSTSSIIALPNNFRSVEETKNCATMPQAMVCESMVGQLENNVKDFNAFIDNLPSVSVISQESVPKDMQNFVSSDKDDDTTIAPTNDDDTEGTDTMEEITEGMETIELVVSENANNNMQTLTANTNSRSCQDKIVFDSSNKIQFDEHWLNGNSEFREVTYQYTDADGEVDTFANTQRRLQPNNIIALSPTRRISITDNISISAQAFHSSIAVEHAQAGGVRRSSMTTPDSGYSNARSSSNYTPRPNSSPKSRIINTSSIATNTQSKICHDKSVNSSPKHMKSARTSPIEPFSNIAREHILKQEIDQLQEKLKDTEERLKSLRINHDSLSHLQRDLRENNSRLHEESETLKLEVQSLNECAKTLRIELQAARSDRHEALEVQKVLQQELEESKQEKKNVAEQKEKDAKVIQDLQRQCREMERILMRKHPDSVSALIVAAKNPGKCLNEKDSRKLLEQRIAQLESDAKEQDLKAQKILANVQARFNSVQAKYETHIADLETQVLSLQEINTKLNEKIESQVRTLDYFINKKAEKFYNNCTQTDEASLEPVTPAISVIECTDTDISCNKSSTGTQTIIKQTVTRDYSTNTIGTSRQHSASSSTSSTANSTPNTSRPNSKQSGLRKPQVSMSPSFSTALTSKLPVSQSDCSLSNAQMSAKEDAHLVATIRSMRVDLAIKEKGMQRLTRELDDCKKTIRKLQRERDALKSESRATNSSSIPKRNHDAMHHSDYQTPANTETQVLRETQSKIKLLEADYKSLHDKRLQDLKTLQSAHERELASCHETVRILQQRLNERDEAFAVQKRRKIPVDYYALKAKVSSLERRHTEREERLHLLVEALSKGRLNSALDDLLADNNNP